MIKHFALGFIALFLFSNAFASNRITIQVSGEGTASSPRKCADMIMADALVNAGFNYDTDGEIKASLVSVHTIAPDDGDRVTIESAGDAYMKAQLDKTKRGSAELMVVASGVAPSGFVEARYGVMSLSFYKSQGTYQCSTRDLTITSLPQNY